MIRFRSASLAALASLALTVALPAGAALPQLSLHVDRSSFDLLDAVSIGIVLDNTGKKPVDIVFPTPTEYEIDVLRGNDVVWSSVAPVASPDPVPAHVRSVAPGASTFATYVWNELERDGSSPAPGWYLVRVRLLEARAQPSVQTRLHFIEPTPISAVGVLHVGDAITVAGHLDPLRQNLTDATGSVALSRRLLPASGAGTVVVRGYILTGRGGTRFLSVIRWTTIGA